MEKLKTTPKLRYLRTRSQLRQSPFEDASTIHSNPTSFSSCFAMGGTFRFSIMALKLSSIVEYLVLSAMFYIFVLSRLLRTYLPFHILESQESSYQSFEKTDSLVIPDPDLVCDPHNYNVHILSREPLVLYIEGFLSQDECEHLINVSYVTCPSIHSQKASLRQKRKN